MCKMSVCPSPKPHVSHHSYVAIPVPVMVGAMPEENGPVSGLDGLMHYLQWKSGRDRHAPFRTCGLTGSVLVLGTLVADRRDLAAEVRARLVHFENLDRLYPGASVPRTPVDCLEFEQRCWWMGISLKQGCYVRAVNRMQGFWWP